MQDTMLGQNIVITERCSSLRQLGRNALRGKWGVAIAAVLIYTLIREVPVVIFNSVLGTNIGSTFTSDGFTYSMDPEMYQQLMNSMPKVSFFSIIYLLLIAGALELGISLFFLASFRGHKVASRDVFLGFERFGKALGLFVYKFVFIYLWSLLFIIPGIIAAIRYSQAFFVLADDPEKSISQCMNESKAMMRGNKMKYFLLSISFIGWMALASIPGGIIESIINTMSTNPVAGGIGTLISGLLLIPVMAYMQSTYAGFYEILAGHLIKETEPAPISPEQISTNAPLTTIEEVIEKVEAKENEASAAKESAGEIQAALPEAEDAVHELLPGADGEEIAGEILDAEVIPENPSGEEENIGAEND